MNALKKFSKSLPASKGFTLIEVVIAIAIFLILTIGIYFTYANLIDVIGRTRTRTLATTLLNKEIEIIRNLKYDDVGIIGGFPVGQIQAEKTLLYEGQTFLVNAYVRSIDDAFDGTTGGSPNDTAPADYKLVHLQVTCSSCFNFVPVSFTTWVSPQNLETSTQNGSLFINVFDANGQPVSNANVLVTNSSTTPTITINDSTNVSGTLQLVDIPTSTVAYKITITKTGYSTSQTWTPGAASNPNPIQPHATVASQAITAISFGIDRVSTLTARTQDALCQGVGSVSLQQVGARLIGTGPDVPAYSSIFSTDSTGSKTISNLPWDTYTFTNLSATHDLAGMTPLSPLTVDPNTSPAITFLMEPKATTALLATIVNASGSPISDAAVNLKQVGFDETKYTGEKFVTDTDWSNGQFSIQDGNVETNNPTGQLAIKNVNGTYTTTTTAWLISNTINFGTSTTALRSLSWNPINQPGQTGANSLRIQLASNNDNATWVYIGPDGTPNTYYTATTTLAAYHNNNQYLRYKVYLNTLDQSYTPSLQDIQLGYSSGCIPSGQAFWSGLSTGTYTATVSKSGFATVTSSVSVGTGWQEAHIVLP